MDRQETFDAFYRTTRRQVLHQAFKTAMHDPTHIAELAKYDQELAYLGPDEYAQVMRDTFQAERRVVERLGLARTS